MFKYILQPDNKFLHIDCLDLGLIKFNNYELGKFKFKNTQDYNIMKNENSYLDIIE